MPPLPSGIYLIEHWNGDKIINTYPTEPLSDPRIEDLQKVGKLALRSYWKFVDGKLVKRNKLIDDDDVPHVIIVRSPAGAEICRWSLNDERAFYEGF